MKTNPIYQGILDEAHEAGRVAAERCVPTPMFVTAGDLFTGKPVPGAPVERVDDGVCGFAWVHLKGNVAFGKWAKKSGYTFDGYPSGLLLRLHERTQSLARKEAYGRATAAVLKAYGIDAYMTSRID